MVSRVRWIISKTSSGGRRRLSLNLDLLPRHSDSAKGGSDDLERKGEGGGQSFRRTYLRGGTTSE